MKKVVARAELMKGRRGCRWNTARCKENLLWVSGRCITWIKKNIVFTISEGVNIIQIFWLSFLSFQSSKPTPNNQLCVFALCVYLQQLIVISTVIQYILVGAERQSWARNRWNRTYKLWHKTLSHLVNPKAFVVARVHLENTDLRTVEDRHCALKATRMRHKNLSSIPHLQLSIVKCLWGSPLRSGSLFEERFVAPFKCGLRRINGGIRKE